jgi:hypothetical protein
MDPAKTEKREEDLAVVVLSAHGGFSSERAMLDI